MSLLPEGYKRLLYIESTGTQYVDTGISPQSDDVVYECEWTEPSLNSGCSIFGSTNTNSSSARWSGVHYRSTSTNLYSATGGTDGVSDIANIVAGVKNVLKTTISGGYVLRIQNGEVVRESYSGSIQNGINIGIFADIRNSDVIEKCSNVRIHKWKMTDNGVVVRNFIPCTNPDGIHGLYDIVESKFYGDAAGGTFVAGPEWGYAELEYIESSGTQYIDTDFTPDSTFGMSIDFEITSLPAISLPFGVSTNWGVNAIMAWFTADGASFGMWYGAKEASISSEAIGRHLFTSQSNKYTLDGVLTTFAEQSFSASGDLFLFAYNRMPSTGATNFTHMRVYSCQIYGNGVLVRDFIPVKLTDDSVGLLDKLTEEFYPNMGTGAFVAGPAIATDYVVLEYIESTGEQYIDTGLSMPAGFHVVTDFMFMDAYDTLNTIIGSHDTDAPYYRNYLLADANLVFWNFGFYGNTTFGTPGLNVKYAIDACNISGEIFCKINDVAYSLDTSGATSAERSAKTLYLFGMNYSAGLFPSVGRMYKMQIYSSGGYDDLVRNYIPIRNNHGVVGLLDTLTGYFYPSETAVAFIAGPEVPSGVAPEAPSEILIPYTDFANVLLVWPASEYVEGYNIIRDGELIATTPHSFYFDGGLDMKTAYSYSITAYNSIGESEAVEITAETTEFKLITDRTAADVQRVLSAISTGNLPGAWFGGMKGAYNATDLNRVESAVLFVIERLKIAGWYLLANTKHWTMVDFPTASEMQRYLDNIRLLRSALPVGMPTVPTDTDRLMFNEANTIEQILEMLDAAVTNIMLNVYYSSEIYSGEV